LNQSFAGHFAEVARRHNLPFSSSEDDSAQPCSHSLTQAVYRLGPWCVKFLEPHSIEGDKLSAERAIFTIVGALIPIPRLLGWGTTTVEPVHAYHIYEWIEGRLWKTMAPKMQPDDRIRLLRECGSLLEKLHYLPVPKQGNVPDIPRGNYVKWRTRNLPVLQDNLSYLEGVGHLSNKQAKRVEVIVENARTMLFHSPTALIHGDFSGQNILIDDQAKPPKVAAVIDWGNVGVDPLEADYEMVLLDVLLPTTDDEGNVKFYDPMHFKEMCRAFEKGYGAERGLGIDWDVMRAHALLQWTKRCVYNYERNPSISRSLAASIRMAVQLDYL